MILVNNNLNFSQINFLPSSSKFATMIHFGDRIRKALEFRNMQSQELAEKLHITKQSVSALLKTESPKISRLKEVERILKFSLEKMKPWEEEKPETDYSENTVNTINEPVITYSKTTKLNFTIELSDDMDVPANFNERVKRILLGEE